MAAELLLVEHFNVNTPRSLMNPGNSLRIPSSLLNEVMLGSSGDGRAGPPLAVDHFLTG